MKNRYVIKVMSSNREGYYYELQYEYESLDSGLWCGSYLQVPVTVTAEFLSASLILNPHNSNHVIRPKPKTYQQ
jgi:hypothetical protein